MLTGVWLVPVDTVASQNLLMPDAVFCISARSAKPSRLPWKATGRRESNDAVPLAHSWPTLSKAPSER